MKASTPAFGTFTPRALLAFALCSAGALLALVALTRAEISSAGDGTSALAPGTITTFTGDGGFSGIATNTALQSHGSVFYNGHLYVADSRWQVVRKIDLTTGAQIVIAGNGLPNNGVDVYNGDGIPAVQAQLRSPFDLAIDSAGNLYISDFGNHRIRKVDKLDGTGTITTVAGNGQAGYNGDGIPATAAQLSCPEGIDLDAAGNLYIADRSNNRVRKVDAQTQTITSVAGTGLSTGSILCLEVPNFGGGYNGDNIPAAEARLNAPIDVRADAAGNLYITEFWNHRIRKVSAGIITTYAGTGAAGFGGDGGPAASAQISNPRGMDLDAAGNLYFADEANQRIRKIDNSPQRVISTVAGNGTLGFSGDGGPATQAQLVFPKDVSADPAGNLYVADNFLLNFPQQTFIFSLRIRQVNTAGTISTIAGNGHFFFGGDGGAAKSGQFDSIVDIAVGAGCNLYITTDFSFDQDLHRVRKVACDGTLTTFAGTGLAGYSGDGGQAVNARLTDPAGVTGDAAGNVYIADTRNYRIRKVDTSGIITTFAGTGAPGFAGDNGPAASAQFFLPEGVAIDGAGNVYIADSGNYRVRRIEASPPHTITTVAGNGAFGYSGDNGPATAAQINYAYGIALDAVGNLFIADRSNNRVRRVDAVTKTITTVAGSGAGCGNVPCPTGDGGPAISALLNSPEGIAFDPAGNLYIADGFNNRVRKVTAGANGTIEGTDIISTLAGTGDKAYGGDGGPATAAQLNFPKEVALDGLGNLYVADFANRRVRRVEAVAPPILSAVVSRKVHGTAGSFDVDLPLAGPRGIECRSGGANNNYMMVFIFLNPLTSVGGASVTNGSGTVSSSAIDSSDARRYIVNLTGVTNAQTIVVTLTNVNDSAGNHNNAVSAAMAVLVGDVNENRLVTNTDVGEVKSQVAAPVTASSFRNDVNANGIISNTDVSATKAQVSTSLP